MKKLVVCICLLLVIFVVGCMSKSSPTYLQFSDSISGGYTNCASVKTNQVYTSTNFISYPLLDIEIVKTNNIENSKTNVVAQLEKKSSWIKGGQLFSIIFGFALLVVLIIKSRLYYKLFKS